MCYTNPRTLLYFCTLPHKRSPEGVTSDWDCKHLTAAYYSLIDPERTKGWVSLALLSDIFYPLVIWYNSPWPANNVATSLTIWAVCTIQSAQHQLKYNKVTDSWRTNRGKWFTFWNSSIVRKMYVFRCDPVHITLKSLPLPWDYTTYRALSEAW